MADLYADEDFDFRVVVELRLFGHDVLTVQEAGQANQRIGDADVLAFAIGQGRAVLTFNRRDFINLHRLMGHHHGIVACTRDRDTPGLASRIHQEILARPSLQDQLLRITRPQSP
jgi:Domain of unknown function (DUF5615)